MNFLSLKNVPETLKNVPDRIAPSVDDFLHMVERSLTDLDIRRCIISIAHHLLNQGPLSGLVAPSAIINEAPNSTGYWVVCKVFVPGTEVEKLRVYDITQNK
jgi:hypothetical protein